MQVEKQSSGNTDEVSFNQQIDEEAKMFFQSYESSSKSDLEDELREDISNIYQKESGEVDERPKRLASESSAPRLPIVHEKSAKRFKNL